MPLCTDSRSDAYPPEEVPPKEAVGHCDTTPGDNSTGPGHNRKALRRRVPTNLRIQGMRRYRWERAPARRPQQRGLCAHHLLPSKTRITRTPASLTLGFRHPCRSRPTPSSRTGVKITCTFMTSPLSRSARALPLPRRSGRGPTPRQVRPSPQLGSTGRPPSVRSLFQRHEALHP